MERLKKTDQVWIDGKLVPWDAAQVHVMNHSLHYGLGAFEGIRCYKAADGRRALFRLHDHVQRLFDSAHICLIEMPYTQAQIAEVCAELIRVNKMEVGYVRPMALVGAGAMGLGASNPTTVIVVAWDWGAYLGEEGLRKGIRAKVSSFMRMHVNTYMVRGKITGQYVNSVLAKREALLAGYDEAILLDVEGYVAEASGENIFVVRKGIVRTPSLSSPILNGITRQAVIQLLRDKGYEVEERTFTRDSLYTADEVFLTGTAAEVTPVREIDNRKVGHGEVGPVTQWVQQAFFRAARGEEPRYREWLTYV